MATISLNVSYLNQSKKLTVSKSSSVSQLVSQCLTVYKVDSSSYRGELYHNDKLIDLGLPIRLTNLINNSKLVLKVKKLDLNKMINVKLITEKGSLVDKCNANIPLSQVLSQFKVDTSKPTQLRILNSTVNWARYQSTSLGSLLGAADSVAMRLEYTRTTKEEEAYHKKQQEAVKLQIEQEKKKRQIEEEKRKLEEREREKEKEREEEKRKLEEREEKVAEARAAASKEAEMDTGLVNAAPTTEDIEMIEGEERVGVGKTSTTKGEISRSEATSASFVYQEEELKETPQLYVPSDKPQPSYENPDEDYHVTVHQVKTYQNAIRNSAQRTKKNPNGGGKIPPRYLIRIKFPDGSMLQINLLENVSEIKFGNLIKKIDELLLPQFIDNYSLKIGFPPFTKLNQSFTLNQEYLYKLPDFQNEQIILIWELSKNSLNKKGPFLNSNSKDLVIKQSDELPERILEKHRSELPSDTSSGKQSSRPKSALSNEEDKKGKHKLKIPKWMKINK
ncbi:hypothetical protein KGF56_004021 [Candida oxycetoniae]|uniref:TUG ubiquitin-like domain-containing protein n=1 Tax=Candida oxycetoniae TaxID=497107 RepID=A0AAI9SU60_9ASCO|nr:uncharacterized protein KGF56_004021 [Candida oxycetoniae]KAI3403132.2 hypothetical protein KGF56_004021 [Candida oxycetoniae]